jgi:hypothetical protein
MEANETRTVHIRLFDGGWSEAPHRVLRNRTVDEWEKAGRPSPGTRPSEGERIANRSADGAAIERYSFVSPRQDIVGRVEQMALYAGQGVGLARQMQPAATIVATLACETEAVLKRLALQASPALPAGFEPEARVEPAAAACLSHLASAAATSSPAASALGPLVGLPALDSPVAVGAPSEGECRGGLRGTPPRTVGPPNGP